MTEGDIEARQGQAGNTLFPQTDHDGRLWDQTPDNEIEKSTWNHDVNLSSTLGMHASLETDQKVNTINSMFFNIKDH